VLDPVDEALRCVNTTPKQLEADVGRLPGALTCVQAMLISSQLLELVVKEPEKGNWWKWKKIENEKRRVECLCVRLQQLWWGYS